MLFYGGGFWTYFLFVGLPIMALSLLASNWVKRTYARYSQVRNSSGLSGVEVARRLLTNSGLSHVQVQVIDGDLVKVMSWYDNEWGYSSQMVREAQRISTGAAGHPRVQSH